MASKSTGATAVTPSFIGAVEDEWQMYSDCEADYVIGSPIGFGASSIVYAATYQPPAPRPNAPLPLPIPCALKVLDLDALPPRSLSLLQRETTLMSLSKHPNVLRVRGSWMTGHKLYIALRLMNKGSAADVMRYGWPGGLEEDVVRCILRQALQGLNYLHINGFIHRDIKAANLLIDDDGTVLLGDLGVAADLAEDTSHRSTSSKASSSSVAAGISRSGQTDPPKRVVLFDHTTPLSERPKMGKRKSFVGTPCWMAPELIQGHQYDSSADIWSFGITALELTQGRPPRSRETPQRVLMRTIQDEPPTLERDGGTYRYSRALKELVESCLIKDPSKRPTAQDLLQTPFFKASKKKSYLVGAILKDLPPLTQRQERRVLKNSQTMQSLDSWDFATTMTTGHPGVSGLHQRLTDEDLVLVRDSGEVFEMDADLLQHGAVSTSRRHSKELTWADQTGQINLEDDVLREVMYDPSPSSSPPSDAGSSDPVVSTPSTSLSADSSKSSPLSSPITVQVILSHSNSATAVAKTVESPAHPPFLSSSVPSSILSTPPSSFSSSPRHGLWHRVKSNVRGSSSRSGRNTLSPFVLGALLGTQAGREVEIVNTFELALTEEDEERLDEEFLVSRRDQYKQVFPSLEFIGWYTVTPYPTSRHIAFHDQATTSSVNAQTLPFKAYEPSVEIRERTSRSVFIEVPYNVETGEAERIAVDWTARGGGTGTSLESHLQTQRSAVKMLHERILVLVKYITDVIAGQAKKDHATLRSLAALVASLPATENKAFRDEFTTEYADVQLTAVLSSLTKSANILNDLFHSSSTNISSSLQVEMIEVAAAGEE
ncbi:hypothetical protein DXG01_009518 [Tephrocybe rancida]|nr:hypothetical protein DXG01_009518 [Tephrocybe rancida]